MRKNELAPRLTVAATIVDLLTYCVASVSAMDNLCYYVWSELRVASPGYAITRKSRRHSFLITPETTVREHSNFA